MATPKWFDANVYMQNKLAQLKAQEPDANWGWDELYDAFRDAGFVGEEGQYEHFVKFGAAEEVAPNAYFDADEYYAAKAKQYYEEELKQEFTGSEEQIANVKNLIKTEGMNAWTHYQQFGSAEGVNPSNAFDAAAYCAAKAAAMGGDWTAEKIADAIADAGMSVLEHYLTFAGTGEGEVAAGSTYPVSEDEQVVVPNPGETFVLKAGIEQLQGTSGDDVFKAEGAVMEAGDVTDGGAGNDTLEVYGNAALKGTFTNIENLSVIGASTGIYDLSSFSKAFTLKAATGNVNVTNVTNQTLVMEDSSGRQLTATFDGAQTSVELVNEDSNDATFSVQGAKLESVSLTTNVNTKLGDGAGNTVKNVVISALGDSEVTLTGLGALENVTVAGEGSVTLAEATGADINATDSTGGVTVEGTLTAAFTGGAGNDTIILGASTKAHDMGAGDDMVVLDGKSLGTGGSVDGGDGVDTLAISTDNARTMTAENFKAFTNFEVLGLNGGNAATIDLDKFGDINHVAIINSVTGAVTIDHMDSEGTLEFNKAAGEDITVKVTEADEKDHSTDVLNVKLSAVGHIDNDGNNLTVADVETINIEADDADDNGDAAHTLKLTAKGAKSVNVTGDADLTLSGDFAKGATIDISANTADVTFTANKTDSSQVTDENTLVTLKGFTDGDTIKIDGGAKTDVFGAKMELGTNWDIQDCLENAVKQDGKAAWFEFGDNTYILFSNDEILGADDVIVKLAGTDYDLEGLNLDGGELTLGA